MVFQFVSQREEYGVDVIRMTVVLGRRLKQRHIVLVRELHLKENRRVLFNKIFLSMTPQS